MFLKETLSANDEEEIELLLEMSYRWQKSVRRSASSSRESCSCPFCKLRVSCVSVKMHACKKVARSGHIRSNFRRKWFSRSFVC